MNKKILAPIAVPGIALLFLLAGCQQNTPTITTGTQQTTPPVTTTSKVELTVNPPAETQASMTQMVGTQDAVPNKDFDASQETGADSGAQKFAMKTMKKDEKLYTLDVAYPHTGNKDVDTAIETMIHTQVDPYLQEVPTDPNETPGPYSLTITYSTTSFSPDVVSFIFDTDTYTGGAHPNTFTTTETFNMKTGKEIALQDLFLPKSDYLKILSKESRAQVTANLGEYVVQDMLDSGTTEDPTNFQNFALYPDSMVIYFAPYDVAPYAAGPQTANIPFSSLSTVLAPEFKS